MKRTGGLWDRLVGWENLLGAAANARRGKTLRPAVARFEFRREWDLLRLQRELESGTYRPGEFTTHRITRPKPRLISAAPYRDRVVHHAILRVLEPILDCHFHPDSYACRKGKGTHAASRRLQHLMRRNPFALQCDIRQFFPGIDHEVMKETFRRLLKDRRLLELLDTIVDGSNDQDPAVHWFPEDDLFTPFTRRRGLPIGNLTSQWFANWYLNRLDHTVTTDWRVGGYVRYCDDFVILDKDRGRLEDLRGQVADLLDGLRLRLHPGKTAVVPTHTGLTFVGYRTWPHRREVRGTSIRAFLGRLRAMRKAVEAGAMMLDEVRCRVAGWLGHASQADSFPLFRRLARRWPFPELSKERQNKIYKI
jgi:retron-type reverse transcriptase